MYTASTAMLEALQEAGVSYIFANFGSDHPALVEAIAEARALGRPIPAVVTCPNEMVAMSCAHGYAQLTGRAQAVVVHVDCGTQSLPNCALRAVSRARRTGARVRVRRRDGGRGRGCDARLQRQGRKRTRVSQTGIRRRGPRLGAQSFEVQFRLGQRGSSG